MMNTITKINFKGIVKILIVTAVAFLIGIVFERVYWNASPEWIDIGGICVDWYFVKMNVITMFIGDLLMDWLRK